VTFPIEVRDGWLWPSSDTDLWKVARDYTILEMALPHCKQRRVAIQAGGACGTFPMWLSDHFETVYTFEPDPVNFTCLVANCQRANVVKMQAALSSGIGTSGLVSQPGNCGAGHLDFNDSSVPCLRLEFMLRGPVDLLQLDVEGAEELALDGALDLINRFHPVIVAEDKGHHSRFNLVSPSEWCRIQGYREVGAYGRDKIFVRAA
jgi:FkbM family methyltransferase